MPRPHWRKMTWVIIIWCALILVWMIAGGSDAANNSDCANEPTAQARQLCEDATDVGAGIGVALVGVLGFFGFVTLSIIWFMTRPKGRDCPVCGEKVKKGLTTCPHCGYDFSVAAGASPPAGTAPPPEVPPPQ